MASSTRSGDEAVDREIRLTKEGEWWVARDVEAGVTSQGKTRDVALANLDDAVALHHDETGRAPTDAELRQLGIAPEDNVAGEQEPPDVLE